MASRKGIAITAAIVAGIVGASFLVWFVPQSSPGSMDIPRTDSEVISDVYSRHLDLASGIESDFASWGNGTLDMQQMRGRLDVASAETQRMLQDLQRRQPAQEWQQSYDLYEAALDTFAEYIAEIESAVEAENNAGPHEGIATLESEWRDYVEESVQAMPAGRPLTTPSSEG